MKINATHPTLLHARNHSILQLTIDNPRHTSWLGELDDTKQYSVEIKEVKSKRSLQQNAFMWKLLHELEKVTREPAMDWYIKALIDTGAVVDYIWGTEPTEDTLKKTFRAVQKVKPHKIKDSDGWLYRVIVGSSKMNVSEMNQLIDTVLRYCHEHDIETEMFNYE